MARTGVSWIKAPSDELIPGVEDYAERSRTAVHAVAEFIAQKMQNESRENAPWTDRTGNARSGLFATAEAAAKDVVTVYLSHGHTVFYGKWLEVRFSGKYAIIWPTIEANLPVVERMLKSIFS